MTCHVKMAYNRWVLSTRKHAMVKVVGEAPEAVKHATCSHCAAKLEYTKSEVREKHGTDYGGGPDGREWIVCPRCGHDVVLRAW